MSSWVIFCCRNCRFLEVMPSRVGKHPVHANSSWRSNVNRQEEPITKHKLENAQIVCAFISICCIFNHLKLTTYFKHRGYMVLQSVYYCNLFQQVISSDININRPDFYKGKVVVSYHKCIRQCFELEHDCICLVTRNWIVLMACTLINYMIHPIKDIHCQLDIMQSLYSK